MRDFLSEYLEEQAAILDQEADVPGTSVRQDAEHLPRQVLEGTNEPVRDEHVRLLPDAERQLRLKRRLAKLLED